MAAYFEQAAPVALNLAAPTIWSRLLGSTRDGTLNLAQQVQVRDPLWFLARQWQVGEFQGFDGGSPIDASYRLEQSAITAYRTGQMPAAEAVRPADPPLELRVEQEEVVLGLRGSVQLGLRFESLVAATLGNSATAVLADFRARFAIAASPPPTEIPDPAAILLRSAVAGRVVDGWALYQAILGPTPPGSILSEAGGAVATFGDYCRSLYATPAQPSAWNAADLRFEFTDAAESPEETVGLAVDDFPGGKLDWYAFDYRSPADPAQNPQPEISANLSVIPHRIDFPGLPGNKWWDFEDSQTDLGSLDTQLVDLPKMLVSQFAGICANNWFEFSVPTQLGALNRIAALVVTDTFGIRTLISPTGEIDPPAGTGKVWQMFTLSGDASRRDTLLLPAVLGQVFDGEPVEEVLFFRDDMAAMCWAIERSLDGPLDRARNAYEAQLAPVPPPPALPAGVDVNWLVGTTVPRNWIPLLPFTDAEGSLQLRRGAMMAPDASGTLAQVLPQGVILMPGQMLLVADQAVPRAGVQVERYMRRARWTDGSSYCWMARRCGPGQGQGSSGLAFDSLETPAAAGP